MILRATDLRKDYPVRGSRRRLHALAGVSLELERGETLGIVGESGCGKSTLARVLVGLERPTAGTVEFDGVDLTALPGARLRERRRRLQMVFQDPYASLNPRHRVGDAIEEVLRVHRLQGGRRRVHELLEMVGLGPTHAASYPHELSGGQRQRVSIARALAAEPTVLILDEPVSALDVSVRAGVMNLLTRLRDELGLSYVFISHDLLMVRHISTRIAVMYLGRIVEFGPWDEVLDRPLHPYTEMLRRTMPVPDPSLASRQIDCPVRGEVADPARPPHGCPFHPRCLHAETMCQVQRPHLVELRSNHFVACHISERRFAGGSVRGAIGGGA